MQAVLVGPHDSLAMATVPYFVADGLSFSVSTSQEFFSEKLALLPWTFHPTSHKVVCLCVLLVASRSSRFSIVSLSLLVLAV